MIVEYLFGREWEITPAGGATGEAFIATHDNERLFLKRNSSPFLAVLSAEGIVPKLVWTKRLENGDVIIAQEWLNGRELQPVEMTGKRVAKLLKKIHSSVPLQTMLQRLGKSHFKPEMMLANIKLTLDNNLLNIPIVEKSIQFLQFHLPNVHHQEYVVCHGDVNHNNWLLSDENELYLIDWDGAMLADPAIDLGMLLYCYVPKDKWEQWLALYEISLTDQLLLRMKWYFLTQALFFVEWHREKNRYHEMNYWIQHLHSIFD